MYKIGIYGGSFDPVTKNHISVAETVLEYVDEVWFVPCYQSPTKNVSPAIHRLNMLNIVMNKISNNNIKISELEIENKFVKTIDTVNLIKSNNPNIHFYFIIGLDVANKFIPTGPEASDLAFIVVSRNPYQMVNDWFLREPHIYIDLKDDGGSSSQVRKLIKENKYPTLIDIDIYNYILHKNYIFKIITKLYYVFPNNQLIHKNHIFLQFLLLYLSLILLSINNLLFE